MSAQTRYGYSTPAGHAGGIYDLAPYAVDSFLNEAENGAMKFGMGVVYGADAAHIAIPDADSAATNFAGIATNNRTTEYDMDGKLSIRKGAPVGVMRYGRIYGRIAAGVEPAANEAVHLIVDGDEAGCFTNTEGEGTTIAIKARFLSGVDTVAQVAVIELFNQAQE